jgi:hypothetical protein
MFLLQNPDNTHQLSRTGVSTDNANTKDQSHSKNIVSIKSSFLESSFDSSEIYLSTDKT